MIDLGALGQVPAGRRLVLFGPNGAGKTSLLREIANRTDLEVGYLPQRPWMFRGTGRRNLTLGLEPERGQLASDIAHDLGVGPEVLDRPARLASGGERQRIALARVLATDTELILLDEPLAPLDLARRLPIAAAIGQHIGDRTAAIVTHDRSEASVIGDDIAVVLDRSVAQRGPVEEVFALPATPEVAAAVGVSNVLRGTVEETSGPLARLDVGGTSVWGVGGGRGPAVAMFGAETVTVHRGVDVDAGSARNAWRGVVAEVRSAGQLREVVVDIGVRVVALLTPGSVDALGIIEGADVTLVLKATAVRIAGRG